MPTQISVYKNNGQIWKFQWVKPGYYEYKTRRTRYLLVVRLDPLHIGVFREMKFSDGIGIYNRECATEIRAVSADIGSGTYFFKRRRAAPWSRIHQEDPCVE